MKLDKPTEKIVLRFVLTAILLPVSWSSVPYAVSQSLPDTIDRVRSAVVRVVRECSYGMGVRRFGGTGFLVSEGGFALTAAHVVEPCATSVQSTTENELLPLARQQLTVGFPVVHTVTDQTHTRRNFTFVGAEVVQSDATHDVALLKLSQNPFRTPIDSGYTLNGKKVDLERPGIAQLSDRKLREGESIAISGYPLEQTVLDTNSGIVASVHSSKDFDLPTYFNSGTDQLQVRVTFDLYEADMRVNHGNSGGPVYGVSTGHVIGVCSATRLAQVEEHTATYNSGLAVIVPIAYGIILMSQHGIAIPEIPQGRSAVAH